MGKVNCERYKQLCSQVLHSSGENQIHLLSYVSKAEVTGYPTVRIYNKADDFLVSYFLKILGNKYKANGAEEALSTNTKKFSSSVRLNLFFFLQDYELVREREVNDIVNLVEDILKDH